MELDEIFMDSFGYAKSNWGKVAMLGVIFLVPFILWIMGIFLAGIANNTIVTILIILILAIISIIAAILYLGYVYRVIKDSLDEKSKLPKFDDFVPMMVDGIKVLVVWIIYGIIIGIILAIIWGIVFGILILVGGATSMFMSPTSFTNPSTILGSGIIFWILYLVMFIAYLVSIAVAILYAILLPMGITNMASEGNIGSAFSISDIRKRIDNIRWLKAILWVVSLYFLTVIVAGLVSGILMYLLIGFIVVPLLIVPLVSIFVARSSALLYKEGE